MFKCIYYHTIYEILNLKFMDKSYEILIINSHLYLGWRLVVEKLNSYVSQHNAFFS